MEKSNGEVRIVKIPLEEKPTEESLRKLDLEIKAQIYENLAMELRSYINASKKQVKLLNNNLLSFDIKRSARNSASFFLNSKIIKNNYKNIDLELSLSDIYNI